MKSISVYSIPAAAAPPHILFSQYHPLCPDYIYIYYLTNFIMDWHEFSQSYLLVYKTVNFLSATNKMTTNQ